MGAVLPCPPTKLIPQDLEVIRDAKAQDLSISDKVGYGALGSKKLLQLITFSIKKTPKYIHNLGALTDIVSDLKDLYQILNSLLNGKDALQVIQEEIDQFKAVSAATLALERTREAMFGSEKLRKKAALIDFASTRCAVEEGIEALIRETGFFGCLTDKRVKLLPAPTVRGAKDEGYHVIYSVHYREEPVRKYCAEHSSKDSLEQSRACTLAVRAACESRAKWLQKSGDDHVISSFIDDDITEQVTDQEKRTLITHYYHEVLGRTPRAEEIESWVSHLKVRLPSLGKVHREHITNRGDFERKFLQAAKIELRVRKDEIAEELYRKILNRKATPEEIKEWAGRLELLEPATVSALERQFKETARAELEVRKNRIVNELYQKILQRTPSVWEFEGWAGTLMKLGRVDELERLFRAVAELELRSQQRR